MTPTEERLRAVLAETAGTVREDTLRPLAVPARRQRRWPRVAAPIAAAAAVVTVLGIEIAVGRMAAPPKPANGAAPPALAIKVGNLAQHMAYDGANGTLYVAVTQYTPRHDHRSRHGAGPSFRIEPGTLAMVNAAACNASNSSGCAHVSYAPTGGRGAAAVVVDERTHTAYVLNRLSKTVAVINTATCNALNTSGCSQHPALVRLPASPASLAINPQTGSLYVAASELGHSPPRVAAKMLVINGASCNASDTGGCTAPVSVVPLSAEPGVIPDITVDPATDTIYIGGPDLAIVDGRTCNATDTLGCVKVLATVPADGSGVQPRIALDPLNGTLYKTVAAPTAGSGTVALVNAKTCNAVDATGCAAHRATIRGGPEPTAVTADPAASTLHVTNGPGAVSMIDMARCNVSSVRACTQFPAAFPTAFPVGTDPQQIVVSPAMHTVYVLNSGSGNVSVINSATCNATDTRGCPRNPPAGTRGQTPYTCDGIVSAYKDGAPAGPLTRTSALVALGKAGSQDWSLWARKGVVDPYGVEQGGLVLNGRWYSLCHDQLSAGADAEFDLVNAGTHGIVYGFIQHPTKVSIRLGNHSPRWTPQSAQLPGTTFFIFQLPRSACAYHGLTVNAWQGKHWGGYSNASYGACLPNQIVKVTVGRATWGPGVQGQHW